MRVHYTKRKRRFIDAPQDERCKYDITLRDGSGAQCGRRKVDGDYCRQHAAIVTKTNPSQSRRMT